MGNDLLLVQPEWGSGVASPILIAGYRSHSLSDPHCHLEGDDAVVAPGGRFFLLIHKGEVRVGVEDAAANPSLSAGTDPIKPAATTAPAIQFFIVSSFEVWPPQNATTLSLSRINSYSSCMVDSGHSSDPAECRSFRQVPQARISPP